ncbi:hypothetical protein H5410_050465 [Solanum commersonii]|uniref:Uncharacterized protein n=1 Tax=Solanum commersonii TaxID=4109 RepID=A0A9J5WY06_SOLCO|nr:hypothetical protein H5410_050465 [Solanum commersonii]
MKKTVVEEPKSNLDSDTMVEIDNYEDSSAQASDDVESSEENTDSGDKESSRDTLDTGDEDYDPLSFPICGREIFGVTGLTSPIENKEDEILGDNNSNQPSVDEDYTPLTLDENCVAIDID